MTRKELLYKVVDELPDEPDWDEVIDRILYIQGIERGLEDVEAGRTISHEEMLKRIESWQR
jgi:predicted transcriptional regulator